MTMHKHRDRWIATICGLSLVGAILWTAGRYTVARFGGSQRSSSVSGPKARTGSAWFTDVASSSGIRFRHISGQGNKLHMPEILAGGVCLLDFDRDGYLDVYFVQAGHIVKEANRNPGNELYRNLGTGRFEDVSRAAEIADNGYGMGCACGDFDNDGWQDIYVTNVGPNVLYKNNGDGTFTNVTARAGVGDPGFSASAVFLDYDGDGNLDLFVTNYMHWLPETELACRSSDGQPDYCMPTNYGSPAPDTLYRNKGDGTFDHVSEDTGIARTFGFGLGVVATDFDNDGFTDICVANDKTANQLWMNQGDGTFVDEALMRGIAYSGEGAAEAGMGIDAQDVDGDLDLDVLMTHFAGETHTLYVYRDGYWNDETTRFGLSATRPSTGFGIGLVDLNNDGLLDIYVAAGRVMRGHAHYARTDPYAESNQLFAGVPGGGFEEVQPPSRATESLIHASRGAAFGDYDNDGDIDIFVVNRDAEAYVLQNNVGQDRNWIMFELTNVHGAPAVGARVKLETDGRVRIRELRVAYSYCSSSDPRVHFGLGDAASVQRATIRWADGKVLSMGPLLANQVIKLSQTP